MSRAGNRYRRGDVICSALSIALCAALYASAPTAHAQASAQTEAVQQYDIPAGPLPKALSAWGARSGKQLVFPPDLVAGKTSKGVSGRYTSGDALTRLLGGTGVSWEVMGDSTIVLKRAVAPAPPTTPAPKPEQRTEATETNEEVTELETIVVTGTNIRGVTNPTIPVDTYDRQTIERSGASNLEEFTRLLPQNLATQSQLSFAGGNPYDTFNQNAASAVDLRGLGAESTLSLLNGRRMPSSGGTGFADISVLPLPIIDQVEILSDGASAVYGADAVGGVVNISTRHDFEGFEFQGRAGTVTEGSKQDYQLSLAAGANWDSGNAILSGFYGKDQPLLFADRAFAQPEDLLAPNGFLVPGEETFNVYGHVSQALGPVRLRVDGLFTQQDTAILSPNGVVDYLDNHVGMINTNVNVKLFDGFFFDFFADYSENEGNRLALSSPTETTNLFAGDRLLTLEGRLSGRLFSIAGGDVAAAFGGVTRRENFVETRSDTPVAIDATRWVHAAYGELLVPLVGEGNAMPFVNRLDVSLAGRFETTKSFGDAFTPKVGVRWKPNQSLSIRGGYSKSFRAPNLRSLNARRQAIFYGYNNPGLGPAAEDPRLLPGLVYGLSFSGGSNPDLETENADVYNAGFDWEPASVPGLKIGATYFNIDYRNRIVNVSPHRVLGIAPLNIAPFPEFASLVDTAPDLAFIQSILDDDGTHYTISNFLRNVAINPNDPTLVPRAEDVRVVVLSGPQNIALSKVRGLDLNLSHWFSTDFGDISASLSGTWLLSNKFQATPVAAVSDRLDLVYRPIDLKMRGSLTWQSDGLSVTGAVNYADSYKDDVNQPQFDAGGNIIPRPVDAWTTVDFSISYDFAGSGSRMLDKTKASLSVRNLFNTDPPRLLIGEGFNFDTANATPLGRYVSLTLNTGF